MKFLKRTFIVISSLLLMSMLSLIACDLEVGAAQEPIITQEPAATTAYKIGDEIKPLTIAAISPDGGKLSYQWYSYINPAEYTDQTGTAIDGAISDSFTPKITLPQIYRYYVIVTNTRGNSTAKIQSARITVTISEGPAYPAILKQPSDENLYFSGAAMDVVLSVIAESPEGGKLSYQWFSSAEFTNVGGTLIPGATNTEYTATVNNLGKTYYYVEIINTVLTLQSLPMPSEPSTLTVLATENKASNATFTVNTANKYQYVRGFGGMSVLWDNFPDDTVGDFELMFSPDKLGYNIIRIMIPPEKADIELSMQELIENETVHSGNRFYQNNSDSVPNLNKDQSDYYDLVKVVNKYNGYVLASPWSPPPEYKTNSSILATNNGRLRVSDYANYGNYLAKFAQIMTDNDAPIYVVSLQNEPDYTGDYDGCRWTGNEFRDFLLAAGDFTKDVSGFGGGSPSDRVKLMVGDVANLVDTAGKIDPVLDNETTRKLTDIIGYHIYGDADTRPYDNAIAHNKEMWMSEYNINSGNASSYPNDSTWNYVWKFANCIDLVIRGNNSNAFIWWAAKRFYSMIGDGTYGTVNGTVLPRGHALSHYAKFAKEMNRVQVTASGQTGGGTNITTTNVNPSHINYVDNTGVKVTAFESLDGNTISLVMFTPTNTSGSNGTNMGDVKIQLPAGFVIRTAAAMRSNSSIRSQMETVAVSSDKNSAVVNLPAGTILSVRFTK